MIGLQNKEFMIMRELILGVIAQEVEEIFPEIVETRVNGFKAVRYDRLIAVIIQAIKELKELLDKK